MKLMYVLFKGILKSNKIIITNLNSTELGFYPWILGRNGLIKSTPGPQVGPAVLGLETVFQLRSRELFGNGAPPFYFYLNSKLLVVQKFGP
jgi:hypothetical protein